MKNKIRSWIALGVFFVVYTVLAFALPFAKNAVLWVSYIFGVVAIAAQLYVLQVAFYKETTVKSKFYGFPVANVGVIYLLAQLGLGLVFMALAKVVPLWLPLVAYVVLLGVAVVGFIAADAMRDEVERQDVKLKGNVSAIRALQSRANVLIGQCEQKELTAAVQKLADDFRYSDPVSSDAVAEQEQQLAMLMGELEQATAEENVEVALTYCKRLSAALIERNRLCKLNK